MTVLFIILLFIAFTFVLYLIAKIMIPILFTILKFFALITAISPFMIFMTIGFFTGVAVTKFKQNRKKSNNRK